MRRRVRLRSTVRVRARVRAKARVSHRAKLLALCDACMAAVIGPRLVCASPWARSAWVG